LPQKHKETQKENSVSLFVLFCIFRGYFVIYGASLAAMELQQTSYNTTGRLAEYFSWIDGFSGRRSVFSQ
jgi:hypothetical protein